MSPSGLTSYQSHHQIKHKAIYPPHCQPSTLSSPFFSMFPLFPPIFPLFIFQPPSPPSSAPALNPSDPGQRKFPPSICNRVNATSSAQLHIFESSTSGSQFERAVHFSRFVILCILYRASEVYLSSVRIALQILIWQSNNANNASLLCTLFNALDAA